MTAWSVNNFYVQYETGGLPGVRLLVLDYSSLYATTLFRPVCFA